MLSVSGGISSSYSCGNPCPPHYDYGYIDPDPTDVPVGDSEAHNVLEIDVDSYENQYGPYSATVVAASSSDTNIATFDGSSVNGVSAGDAGTSATVEYPLYWWEIGTYDCTLYGTNEDTVYGQARVDPTVTATAASFNPQTIARSNSNSTLTVQISASSGVPSGTTVDVEIQVWTNPNQVSLTVFNGSTKTNQAVTASQATNVTFRLDTPSGSDTNTGQVTYKARISAAHLPPNSHVIKPDAGEGVVSNTLCVSNTQCS